MFLLDMSARQVKSNNNDNVNNAKKHPQTTGDL